MISLARKFNSSLDLLRNRFAQLEREYKSGSLEIWRRRLLTIGMVINTWQIWCNFIRKLIYLSCKGCLTRGGAQILPRNAPDNSMKRIGYEAFMISRGQIPMLGNVANTMRREPTWGDINKIVLIISKLKPHNENHLIRCFNIRLRGPRDIHIVRNAISHFNTETKLNIDGIKVHYSIVSLKHPSDLAWQKMIASSDIAMYQWIMDIRTMSLIATL